MAAVIIACAVCAGVIEPPFTGEEALAMASVSRFADGGPITLDDTSLLPNARTVYLLQPYQIAVGLISRWSGTDPIVAYLKLRTVLAPLTLIFLYSVTAGKLTQLGSATLELELDGYRLYRISGS